MRCTSFKFVHLNCNQINKIVTIVSRQNIIFCFKFFFYAYSVKIVFWLFFCKLLIFTFYQPVFIFPRTKYEQQKNNVKHKMSFTTVAAAAWKLKLNTNADCLTGTVQRDFRPPVFFHKFNPLTKGLKYFDFCYDFSSEI